MEPEILLYIGGCADGERKKTTHYKMIIIKPTGKPSLIDRMSDDLIANSNGYTEHLYEMVKIRGETRLFCVMLWDGMTVNQMFESLISKYPAPKDDD